MFAKYHIDFLFLFLTMASFSLSCYWFWKSAYSKIDGSNPQETILKMIVDKKRLIFRSKTLIMMSIWAALIWQKYFNKYHMDDLITFIIAFHALLLSFMVDHLNQYKGTKKGEVNIPM